jgi:hypothetical protein
VIELSRANGNKILIKILLIGLWCWKSNSGSSADSLISVTFIVRVIYEI